MKAKIPFRAVIIGTLLFFTLLGLGCMGIRPAFELAIFLSIPSIYVVGPIVNLLPYYWFEGPEGGIVIIMISSWLEIMLISLGICLILHRYHMRNAQ